MKGGLHGMMRRKRKNFMLPIFIGLSLLLGACSNNNDETQPATMENIKELVQDFSEGNIKNQSASITSQQLIVTDGDKGESAYDLPEDDFFVSIAPYVNETHP
jgi:hypothetical protein